jgi:hypothetical protein
MLRPMRVGIGRARRELWGIDDPLNAGVDRRAREARPQAILVAPPEGSGGFAGIWRLRTTEVVEALRRAGAGVVVVPPTRGGHRASAPTS